MSATTYKLVYFNGRGLAETTRLLFAYSGTQYTDHRFAETVKADGTKERAEFVANKESYPFGQAPVLDINNGQATLAQSRAIERYVAHQFNLMGSTPIEHQLVDSVGEAIRDLRDAYFKGREKPEEKAKFFQEQLPTMSKYLARFSASHARGNFFVGSSVTLADIQWYNFLSMFDDQDSITKAIAAYPVLTAIRENIANQPSIKKWVAERPDTPF